MADQLTLFALPSAMPRPPAPRGPCEACDGSGIEEELGAACFACHPEEYAEPELAGGSACGSLDVQATR